MLVYGDDDGATVAGRRAQPNQIERFYDVVAIGVGRRRDAFGDLEGPLLAEGMMGYARHDGLFDVRYVGRGWRGDGIGVGSRQRGGGGFAAVAEAVAGERAAMVGGSWTTRLEFGYRARVRGVLRRGRGRQSGIDVSGAENMPR